MSPRDSLSDEGLAILLLCSMLGLEDKTAPEFAAPLTLSEWNKLALKLGNSSLRTAAGLLGQNEMDLAKALELVPDESQRLVRLLARSGRLTLELENLFSRGMWAMTRADQDYPGRLRDALKHQAPAVLFGAGEIGLLRQAGLAVIGSRNIDPAGLAFSQEVGRKCAAAGLPGVSGGAKGTERLAIQG